MLAPWTKPIIADYFPTQGKKIAIRTLGPKLVATAADVKVTETVMQMWTAQMHLPSRQILGGADLTIPVQLKRGVHHRLQGLPLKCSVV